MWILVALFLGIFVHELGHLIVAKLCKCGVDVFSIGFGKAIWKKKIGNTIYQITPFLLGGYNKLKGEMDGSNKDKDAFTNLTYSKKIKIVLAGATFNFILAGILIGIYKVIDVSVLYNMALLNVLLGVSNLLPFPPLDGSYVFTIPVFEKVWGKKEGYKKLKKVNVIGFIVLHLLAVILLISLYMGIIQPLGLF